MTDEKQPNDNSNEEEKEASENSLEAEETEREENGAKENDSENSEEEEKAEESSPQESPPLIPPFSSIPQLSSPQKSTQPQEPAPPPKPAEFPKGFWRKIDYLLLHSDEIQESLRRDKDLLEISKTLFIVALTMSAIYGVVMGATNLLLGSEMATDAKFIMILVTAVKVPFLFLLTMLIVLPPIYVSNAMVGAQLSFRQVLALLLSSLAITSTTLASLATVSLFFSLTSGSYHSLKLLHVLFFIYSGCTGLSYLIRTIGSLKPVGSRQTPQWIFVTWLLLYMFVGTQLAWVMRPFIGAPQDKFELFAPRSGNIYKSVIDSVENIGEMRNSNNRVNP